MHHAPLSEARSQNTSLCPVHTVIFPPKSLKFLTPKPLKPQPYNPAALLQLDEAQKALQFVSISSDGNVNLWTMNKSELTHEVRFSCFALKTENSSLVCGWVHGFRSKL